MIRYEVVVKFLDEPYFCVKMFDCLDESLDYVYNKSRSLFLDRDSVGLYLYEVFDSKRMCLLYHTVNPSAYDYKLYSEV